MSDYTGCEYCGRWQWQCRCWEIEAAKYNHSAIRGQIKLDELRDELYGTGR